MQKIMLVGLIMATGMGAALSANAANIKVDGPQSIMLTGDIDERTPGDLERALKSVQPDIDKFVADAEKMAPSEKGQLGEIYGPWMTLESGGGDVEAAMRAGEIARKYHVNMRVLSDRSCASACVLLLVGGVDRIIFGNVGIHRPYSAGYSPSLTESEKRYKSVSASVERYLHAMNMPPRLIDAMNATPPDQVHWLTVDELTQFGISASDPVWQDRVDSIEALSRGLSKQGYYARKQQATEQCKSVPASNRAWFDCYWGIMGWPR
jgi:hypothetical protein